MGPNEATHFNDQVVYTNLTGAGHSACVVILSALFYKVLRNWLTCVIPLKVRRDIFKDPNMAFHTPLTPSSTCSYKNS